MCRRKSMKKKLRMMSFVLLSFISIFIFLFYLYFIKGNFKKVQIEGAKINSMINSMTYNEYKYTNALVNEKSPYLQQHAHNPVNWYPWGKEAFYKARQEDKPIFLSIGYSTCHWCHVMERESFNNPEIAEILNKYFISIKVDREERPDIDKIYMTSSIAAGWGSGWPLSVWLTPDLKPFFGGTYFPPQTFIKITKLIAKAWENEREKLLQTGEQIVSYLRELEVVENHGEAIESSLLDKAFIAYKDNYNPLFGGFSDAPKFPMPVNHNFLLRYYSRTGKEESLQMVLHTLRMMAMGGIRDHIGGGFHRYSTDDKWHVPHFEKMLYDNAQITINYLEAYQITKEEIFAEVAREIIEYVLQNITHSSGGFFAAEDADSIPPEIADYKTDIEPRKFKSEGAYYLWTMQEIMSILGKREGEIFSYYYGVKLEGNIENDPSKEFKNKNVLYIAHSISETAKKFGISENEILRIIGECKQKLLVNRNNRPKPDLDDKILVSWNGLMISALARAGQILGEAKYIKSAEKAARFIKSELYDSSSKHLFRRWKDGEKKVDGMAADYAFLIQGLLDLYEASFNTEWLNWAIELTDKQNKTFFDDESGGFHITSLDNDKSLPIRLKEDNDNVEPSASSVATLNLLRLSWFTGRDDYKKLAVKTFKLFSGRMKKQPLLLPQMLVALNFYFSKIKQIVVVGDLESSDTQDMLKVINKVFIPNKILIVIHDDKSKMDIGKYLPFVKSMTRIQNKATVYICENHTCKFPTNDVQKMVELLNGKF